MWLSFKLHLKTAGIPRQIVEHGLVASGVVMATSESPTAGGGGNASSGAPAPTPCNLDQLWDAWVGCIINSECFRVSETELGGKAALKACAQPERMAPHCAAIHRAWTDCKFGLVQGAFDKAPEGFKNPSSVDLALSNFNPLASLWNGMDKALECCGAAGMRY